MDTKYSFKNLEENMARAMSRDLGISMKVSIEIANVMRGKTLDSARSYLERVLKKTQAVPFKRFTDGVGHRAGAKIGSGRYPEKASKEFIRLFNAVEANAQAKGLSSNLKIVHLSAQKGSNQFRGGRQRRRQFKRTHIEVVVEEQEEKKKPEVKKVQPEKKAEKPKAEPKKVAEENKKPQTEKKVEQKPVEKKPEVKKEPEPAKKVEKKLESVEKKPEVKEKKVSPDKKEEISQSQEAQK